MYNYWGLEYIEIVNLFSAELQDFATMNSNDGKTNILQEMDVQQGFMLEKLPSNVIQYFDEIKGIEFKFSPSISGGYQIDLPQNLPVDTSTLELFSVDEVRSSVGVSYGKAYVNKYGQCTDCPNIDLECYGTEVSFQIITENGVTFVYTTDNLENKKLFGNYFIDETSNNFLLPDLKAYLRDKVACVLGGKLMLEGEQQWRLLDTVCATSFEPADNYFPSEYRKYRWWRTPWISGGFRTGKLYRG